MPLYEYYCADCRGKFELLISYAASQGEIVCTKCHGPHVRKLMSVVARSHRGGGEGYDDFGGDDGGYGDGYDDGGDGGEFASGGGGCSCGGACSCGN